MAITLFYFDEKKNLFLHPDAIQLEPLLGSIPAEDLLFIVLTVDYYSPYRQMSQRQKLLTSCRRCFDHDDYASVQKRLKDHIECYDSLQYDFKRATQKNYQAKISALNLDMMAASSPTEIKNIDTAIKLLTDAVERIEHELYTDQLTENSIQNQEKMSMIERWQDNKRRSRSDKNRLEEIRQQRAPKEKKPRKKKEKKQEES